MLAVRPCAAAAANAAAAMSARAVSTLVLHFDVNGTIIMDDPAAGRDTRVASRSITPLTILL